MVTLSKWSFSGEEIGKVEICDEFLSDDDFSPQYIKDYLVALRNNKRQWSANTKGRSEVSHSTKKPFKQKGTGNARQGCLAAAQFRGGGIVFGPKPKFNQHVRINRKERRAAIRALLSQKIKSEQIVVVEDQVFAPKQFIKTKDSLAFLRKCPITLRRILFVDHLSHKDSNDYFRRSIQNLEAFQGFVYDVNLNGYDLASAHGIVISETALLEAVRRLSIESTEKSEG